MADEYVVSTDGTRIAYERLGTGPVVILVGGGLTDRAENAPLAEALASDLTVCNYDRRSRGASDIGDPGLTRELADLEALMAAVAPRSASLVGVSSGGALALELAARSIDSGSVSSLLVYEVPYLPSAEYEQSWAAYVPQVTAALHAGDLDRALELFMGLAGSEDAEIEAARQSPAWPSLRELAPTLAHDAAVLGNGRIPKRLARIPVPVVVATGAGETPLSAFYRAAADQLAAALPTAKRMELDNSEHVLGASTSTAIASVLTQSVPIGDQPLR